MNQNTVFRYLQSLQYTPLPQMVKPFYEGLGVILLFHNISPFDNDRYLTGGFYQRNITPEKLESIISYFKKCRYSFISLDELHDNLLSAKPAGKFVVFTLDDGMYDNYLYAYPVFKKYKVPFTIYIPTKFIGTDETLWTVPLENFLLEKDTIKLSGCFGVGSMTLNSIEAKEAALKHIIGIVEKAGNTDELTGLFRSNLWDRLPDTRRSYMNWDEVKELSRDPLCTIGSHTVNHMMLSRLSDEEAEYELSESKKIIEEQIGKPVFHLGYPHGTAAAVGPREFAIAGKCGYKTATTVRYANIHKEHGNYLHCLPRFNVKPAFSDSILRLIRTGAFQFLLKKGKRIITHQ